MVRKSQPILAARLMYTVEEAAELLSLSRSQLYRLIDVEELPSVKVGKARRITAEQLEAYIRKLEQEQGFTRF